MRGDSLASGGKSAAFRTGGSSLSEMEYDLATLTEPEFLAKWEEITPKRYQELLRRQNL